MKKKNIKEEEKNIEKKDNIKEEEEDNIKEEQEDNIKEEEEKNIEQLSKEYKELREKIYRSNLKSCSECERYFSQEVWFDPCYHCRNVMCPHCFSVHDHCAYCKQPRFCNSDKSIRFDYHWLCNQECLNKYIKKKEKRKN